MNEIEIEFDPSDWEEIEEDLISESIHNLPTELKYKILSHLPHSKLRELELDNKTYWEIERCKIRIDWNFRFDWSLVNFPRSIRINDRLYVYNLIGDRLHRCLSRHFQTFSGLLNVGEYTDCFDLNFKSSSVETTVKFFPNKRPLIRKISPLTNCSKARRFYEIYDLLVLCKYKYPDPLVKDDSTNDDWKITRWLPPSYYDFQKCTKKCVYNTTKIYETDAFLMFTTEPINIEKDDLEFNYKVQSSDGLTTWKIFRNKFLTGIAVLCNVSEYKEFPLKYHIPEDKN
ncbi:hypothetical protein LCDVSa119R [Lymphocystis disease virus 3]|uniref:F-box domain-containing protein n=1 Tax=Lymphocystis disease virus 3 TaxID=2560566 RepID=A0A1B2RW24_9VIRU|nr:hypothetical protein BZK12_gp119 [Lymphocystis disease virus Sa]AOC55203.1 hypothetical protein LCDVSa119R [Lymphocystis disease virus 3]